MGQLIDVNKLVRGGAVKRKETRLDSAANDKVKLELWEIQFVSHDERTVHGYEWELRIWNGSPEPKVRYFNYEGDAWETFKAAVAHHDMPDKS